MQVEFVFFYFARVFIFGHESCAKYIIPTCMNFFGAFPLPPPTTNHGLSIPKKKKARKSYEKTLHYMHTNNAKIRGKFTSTVVELFQDVS